MFGCGQKTIPISRVVYKDKSEASVIKGERQPCDARVRQPVNPKELQTSQRETRQVREKPDKSEKNKNVVKSILN